MRNKRSRDLFESQKKFAWEPKIRKKFFEAQRNLFEGKTVRYVPQGRKKFV